MFHFAEKSAKHTRLLGFPSFTKSILSISFSISRSLSRDRTHGYHFAWSLSDWRLYRRHAPIHPQRHLQLRTQRYQLPAIIFRTKSPTLLYYFPLTLYHQLQLLRICVVVLNYQQHLNWFFPNYYSWFIQNFFILFKNKIFLYF